MNIQKAQQILKTLSEFGVKDFCVCAGSRNAPFVEALSRPRNGMKVYSFFDERSAAYFALGKIKAEHRPVAVVTTSGTAVAELLPATIEAYYSELPLILLTADRPKKYRNSGAPQTIDQMMVLTGYVDSENDISEMNFDFHLRLSRSQPTHINVCFEEPLLDGPHEKWDSVLNRPWEESEVAEVQASKQNYQHPVYLVSELDQKYFDKYLKFLEQTHGPIYFESCSGLRGDPRFAHREIQVGDLSLPECIEKFGCQSVVRLGGIPVHRFWRDLEEKDLPIVSLSARRFRGLSCDHREVYHPDHFNMLIHQITDPQRNELNQLLESDRKKIEKLNEIIENNKGSELSALKKIYRSLPAGANVFLANSLPIREWDLVNMDHYKPLNYLCNRGANGIDGVISTFLGTLSKDSENYLVIGDLSTLYDLSSLWAKNFVKDVHYEIIIVNNFGGQIFSLLYENKNYLNQHHIQFKPWADMWKTEYRAWSPDMEFNPSGQSCITEVSIDPQANEKFWTEWKAYKKSQTTYD